MTGPTFPTTPVDLAAVEPAVPIGGMTLGGVASHAAHERPDTLIGTPIRVYIVHTQPLIAESLQLELSALDDIEVVGVQLTAEHLEQRVVEQDVHILLLDASLHADRLVTVIANVRPVARALIVAGEPAFELMYRCVMAGAAGFLAAPRDSGEIVSAMRRVQRGWMVLTQQQLTELMSHMTPRASDRAARELCERLSEREREILVVLATGATTDQAATLLHISRHTVHSHVKNALRKLNARSKLAAVVLLAAAGLLDEA